MVERAIPGFYYDEGQGKYFKLSDEHWAPGWKYSKQEIKRIKAEEEVSQKP